MRQIISSLVVFCTLFAIACSPQEEKDLSDRGSDRFINIAGTMIYLEEYGDGAPLLLLQGGGIDRSSKDFSVSIPELSKHYHLIIPDTPGQGKSELADSLSYELLTEYTSLLIDSLNLDSTYVMGFSDGGIVSLLLAEKRPDKVKKVIAVGTNNGIRGVLPPGVDPALVGPSPIDIFEKENRATIDKYLAIMPRDWKKLVDDQNKMWYQFEYFQDSILQRIDVPVMIAQGDHDMIRVEHAVELHRLVKNSQLCILPNTSHDVFAERPELINSIALSFFGVATKR